MAAVAHKRPHLPCPLLFFLASTVATWCADAADPDATLRQVAESRSCYSARIYLYHNQLAFHWYTVVPHLHIRHRMPASELQFLYDGPVQNELDLSLQETVWVSDLWKKAKRELDQLEGRSRRIRREAYGKSLVGESDFLVARNREFELYLRHIDSMRSLIRDRLSPTALRRLHQLQVRHRILDGGLLAALRLHRPLATFVGIDEASLNRLDADLPRIWAILDNKVRPVFEQLVTETEKVLTEAQLQELLSALRGTPPAGIPVVEHMLWQCLYAQEAPQRQVGELSEYFAASGFFVTPSGRLKATRHERHSFMIWAVEVLSDGSRDALPSERGHHLIALHHDKIERLHDEYSKCLADWRHGLVSQSDYEEKMREIRRENDKRALAVLRSELTPIQWERLQGKITDRGLRQRGLLPSLVNGSLGKQIGITGAQRAQLRQIAAKYGTRLTSLSQALEKQVWDELSKSLRPEQGRRLRQLLGASPSRIPGAPTLILMANGRAEYRQHLEDFARRRSRMLKNHMGWSDPVEFQTRRRVVDD